MSALADRRHNRPRAMLADLERSSAQKARDGILA